MAIAMLLRQLMAGSRTRPPRPRCSIVGYRPTPVVGIGSQTATLTESESGLWTFRLVGLLPLTSWCDVCYSCHASSDLSVRCCSRALHRVASFASAWKTQNLNGEQSTNCDDPFDVEVKIDNRAVLAGYPGDCKQRSDFGR